MTDLFGNEEFAKTAKPTVYKNLTTQNPDLLPAQTARSMDYDFTKIRKALHKGQWYFAYMDVISVLTDTSNPRRYAHDLKAKLQNEGSEVYDHIVQLKFVAPDGKLRSTQCLSREDTFRLIEEIPSPKAEPFKQWIAHLAHERLEEIENPDLAIQRGYEGYLKKGMSPAKAKARAKTVFHRNELTQKWLDHGINEPKEFAMLTDRESKGTFGKTTGEMKKEKSLTPAQNLRDNMTEAELLAQDASDMAISLLIDKHNPQGYAENVREVDKGSTVGAGVMEMFKRVLAS